MIKAPFEPTSCESTPAHGQRNRLETIRSSREPVNLSALLWSTISKPTCWSAQVILSDIQHVFFCSESLSPPAGPFTLIILHLIQDSCQISAGSKSLHPSLPVLFPDLYKVWEPYTSPALLFETACSSSALDPEAVPTVDLLTALHTCKDCTW